MIGEIFPKTVPVIGMEGLVTCVCVWILIKPAAMENNHISCKKNPRSYVIIKYIRLVCLMS